jgi:hypothetical protein
MVLILRKGAVPPQQPQSFFDVRFDYAYGVEEMAKKKSEIDLRQYLDSQVRPDLLVCPRG